MAQLLTTSLSKANLAAVSWDFATIVLPSDRPRDWERCRRAHALLCGTLIRCPCPAQSVNNYDKEVFNGDPGYILSVDAPARRVRVRYPSSGQPCSTSTMYQTPVQLLTGCTD